MSRRSRRCSFARARQLWSVAEQKETLDAVLMLLGMRGNGYCQSLITETLGPTVHAYLKQSGELNSVVNTSLE